MADISTTQAQPQKRRHGGLVVLWVLFWFFIFLMIHPDFLGEGPAKVLTVIRDWFLHNLMPRSPADTSYRAYIGDVVDAIGQWKHLGMAKSAVRILICSVPALYLISVLFGGVRALLKKIAGLVRRFVAANPLEALFRILNPSKKLLAPLFADQWLTQKDAALHKHRDEAGPPASMQETTLIRVQCLCDDNDSDQAGNERAVYFVQNRARLPLERGGIRCDLEFTLIPSRDRWTAPQLTLSSSSGSYRMKPNAPLPINAWDESTGQPDGAPLYIITWLYN